MKKPVWTKPEGVEVNVTGASDTREVHRGWCGWGRIFGRGVMVRRAEIQHIIFSDPQR